MKNLVDISKILGAVVSILVACWFFGEPFLEDYVDARIEAGVEAKMDDPVIVQKLLSNPLIVTYTERVEDEAIENIIKQDSNKVGMRTIIGQGTGIRDGFVTDTLIVMINERKSKNYVSNAQCIFNSKKYGRGIIKSASF